MKKFFGFISLMFCLIADVFCFVLGFFALKVQPVGQGAGMRRSGSVISGVFDTITQPLYDTLPFTNTTVGEQNFFAQPIGVAGKTMFETNLKQSGQIPQGQVFNLYGFSITLLRSLMTTAELNDFFRVSRAFFVFRLVEKDYLQIPLHFIPQFNGWINPDGTGTGLSCEPISNASYFKMSKVVPIMGNQNFSCVINVQTALSAIVGTIPVTVFMHGTLKRNIQ